MTQCEGMRFDATCGILLLRLSQEDGVNQHYRNTSREVRNRLVDEALAGDSDDFKAGVTSW